MHATCIGHRANIIQLSGPEHAVQTVFTPPCPACPAAALDSNLQVSFGNFCNFVGHFRVRAKKKRRQDVPRSNPSSPFNLQFDMHSPDCDFMAFGKTNFAMLLGSGPSKKFNMQSLFQGHSPEWPYWKVGENNCRPSIAFLENRKVKTRLFELYRQ